MPPRAWRETNVEGDREAPYSFLNVSFLCSSKVFLGVQSEQEGAPRESTSTSQGFRTR